jgi:DHA1 family bicyclomycin/chloramphenicol resistance-like MFS transporter
MKQEGTRKSLILLTVILMDLLADMEFDLFVPSFPKLQNHFSLSPFWVESLLSINFIGYCVSLFICNNSDIYTQTP